MQERHGNTTTILVLPRKGQGHNTRVAYNIICTTRLINITQKMKRTMMLTKTKTKTYDGDSEEEYDDDQKKTNLPNN